MFHRVPVFLFIMLTITGITFAQSTINTFFGSLSYYDSVASIGDVNNDGIEDYVVGATTPIVSNFYGNYGGTGYLNVHSGATHTILYGVQSYYPNDNFGVTVRGVGDINSDGTPDFAVAAPNYQGNAGMVLVFSGVDGSNIHTFVGTLADSLGSAIEGNVDYDGDGIPDIFVGSPSYGKVHIFSGNTGLEISTVDAPQYISGFGKQVVALNDINGDSFADVAIASYNRIYLLSGRSTGPTPLLFQSIDAYNSIFPQVMANAGDVNGDAKDDLIVGNKDTPAPPQLGASSYASGKAVVFSSSTGLPLHVLNAKSQTSGQGPYAFSLYFDAFLGRAVTGLGDIDGDAKSDFAVSGGGADPMMGEKPGFVRVYSGASGNELFTYRASPMINDGVNPRKIAGNALASISDLSGDGGRDLIIATKIVTPSIGSATNWYPANGDITALSGFDATISHIPASVIALPAGCQGTVAPSLISFGTAQVSGAAQIGGTLQLYSQGVPSGSQVYFYASPPPSTSPIGITGSGCLIHLDLQSAISFVPQTPGYQSGLLFPFDLSAVGSQVVIQAMVYDPSLQQWYASNALKFTVGLN